MVIKPTIEYFDFANRDEDYQLLFDKLQDVGKGRHYLNPLPF